MDVSGTQGKYQFLVHVGNILCLMEISCIGTLGHYLVHRGTSGALACSLIGSISSPPPPPPPQHGLGTTAQGLINSAAAGVRWAGWMGGCCCGDWRMVEVVNKFVYGEEDGRGLLGCVQLILC